MQCSLCQQPLPCPLSGGNAGNKELNRWIDNRITHYKTYDVDYNEGEVLRLLLLLLKICAQHYDRLRSPLGSDTSLKENDAPEAIARLFASVKNSAKFNSYGAFAHCLLQVPSEVQMQKTVTEVQTLLVSGKKKEALLRAQEGQLWGPALVLAAQLGDQFCVDTVRKMTPRQFVPGSPLRTLCLLIAGQLADVFAADATTDGGFPGALNMSQQQPTQVCTGGKLYNVVLDIENIGKQLLEKGELRRKMAFIPLNKIQSHPVPPKVQKDAVNLVGKGNAEVALSLVDYDHELQSAMEYVFGSTFVCKTIDAAKKLLSVSKLKPQV